MGCSCMQSCLVFMFMQSAFFMLDLFSVPERPSLQIFDGISLEFSVRHQQNFPYPRKNILKHGFWLQLWEIEENTRNKGQEWVKIQTSSTTRVGNKNSPPHEGMKNKLELLNFSSILGRKVREEVDGYTRNKKKKTGIFSSSLPLCVILCQDFFLSYRIFKYFVNFRNHIIHLLFKITNNLYKLYKISFVMLHISDFCTFSSALNPRIFQCGEHKALAPMSEPQSFFKYTWSICIHVQKPPFNAQ